MAATPLRLRIQRLAAHLDSVGRNADPISTGATYIDLVKAGFVRQPDRNFYCNGHKLLTVRADVVSQFMTGVSHGA